MTKYFCAYFRLASFLRILLPVSILLAGNALLLKADPITVVPNHLTAEEGNANNLFPFDSAVSQRYQQVFDAGQFSAFQGGKLITHIAFRPNNSFFGGPFESVIESIQINLSTTLVAVDALNSVFADNVGMDDQVVFGPGPLTLSSSFLPGPGDSRAFDIVIALSMPFFYDPALGNLLLDIRNFSTASAAVPALDAHLEAGDSVSRVFSPLNSNVNTVSGIPDSMGLVTQFRGVCEVPEPSVLLCLFISLSAVALCLSPLKK